MGASQSSQEQAAPEEAFFDADELAALRNCYRLLASSTGGSLEASSFAQLRQGLPWPELFKAMSAITTPVRWPAFIATVARYCKGRRTEKLAFAASLYSGGMDMPLSEMSIHKLLADALTAANGGDASAVTAALPALQAVAADALLGTTTGMLPVDRWLAWANVQLPTLPLVGETFLLQYLCAVGRLVDSGTAAAVRAQVPAAALNAVQEPLLCPADGQAEGSELLHPAEAWLLSLAICRAVAAEAAEWRCLYASQVMGLSMNRFGHHAEGYGGPTILVVLTEDGEAFGAYIDTPIKASDKFFGGPASFLFTLRPKFHIYPPTGISKNFTLYNPEVRGQLASTSYFNKADGAVPEVIAFGGQTVRFRMSLEDDLHLLRWHTSDTTYGAHAEGGAPAEGERKVRALELWGCGGADADKVLNELRNRRVRDAGRAGKVDRGAMFGMGKGSDWRSEDNPDRMILETAGAHTFYSAQLEKLPEDKR